jgi:hypothetical protein
MIDFFRYDLGYTWPWTYGHLIAFGMPRTGRRGVVAAVARGRRGFRCGRDLGPMGPFKRCLQEVSGSES